MATSSKTRQDFSVSRNVTTSLGKSEEVKQREYAALRFDYGKAPEHRRQLMMDAAVNIRQRDRNIVEGLIFIGQTLIEMKKDLDHGKYLEWAEVEFGYSRQGVNELVLIAQRFAPNVRFIGHLNETSLRLLAGPSVTDDVIAAVISAGAGLDRPMRVREVKAIKLAMMPRPVGTRPPRELSEKSRQEPSGRANAPTTITAEYTVTQPAAAEPHPEGSRPAQDEFAAWLEAMPEITHLRHVLAIYELGQDAHWPMLALEPLMGNRWENLRTPLTNMIESLKVKV